MFEKDITAWTLQPHETDARKVREIHLLKTGDLWIGRWVFESAWRRGQMGMRKPYPSDLRRPFDLLMAEAAQGAMRQERLAV